MKPTPIYKDHTGRWREQNPFPEGKIVHGFPHTQDWVPNHQHDEFERRLVYYDFPNPPEVKPGEVIMAYLQWQLRQNRDLVEAGIDKEIKWVDCREDLAEELRLLTPETFRQIWVAANQSNQETKLSDQFRDLEQHKIADALEEQEGKEDQPKDLGNNNHLCNCPFCNGSEKDRVVLLGYKYPKYRVSCCDCGYFIEDDRKDKVLELWNTRNGKGWLESSLSPSAPKVEMTAEEILASAIGVNSTQTLSDEIGHPLPYILEAMEQYATLKASSLQQENDKLRDEVDRLKESLLKIVHGSIHDAYTTAKEALKVKP